MQLRDIELMVQDRLVLLQPAENGEAVDGDGPEEVLLKQIQAVLYSTEEGFEVPEGQEVRAECRRWRATDLQVFSLSHATADSSFCSCCIDGTASC